MNNRNVIIDGKYKEYHIEVNQEVRTICLTNNYDNIKSITIVAGEDDLYYLELKQNNEKLKCILDFTTYLCLGLFEIYISPSCIGIK